MEKEISTKMETFTSVKSRQITVFCEQRQNLNEIVQTSYEILQDVRRRRRRRAIQINLFF